jgi:hypothetical protein
MADRTLLLLSILLSATLLWGCVSSNVSRLNATERPPVSKDSVTVYLEEESIEGDYDRMAVINIEATANWKDESDVYEEGRKQAAKIGANGVLFEKMEEAGTGERVAATLVGTGADTDARAIAVYVRNSSGPKGRVDSTAESK